VIRLLGGGHCAAWARWCCIGVVSIYCSGALEANAATCAVVQHTAPSEADKAFLTADYKRAEDLYRAALAASPGDAEAIQGLVHTLLREQQVQQAADAVNSALAAAPNAPILLTLRGEVELREGEPWTAAATMDQSMELDPCNPRTHLLAAELWRVNSMYASARRSLNTAHQLDPEDPEIREQWAMTLPLQERIAAIETYLSSPQADDAEELRLLKNELSRWKKLEAEPGKPCRLDSKVDATEVPFVPLMTDADHVRGLGLEVKLNGEDSRLQIDTGAGGLLVSRAVAKRAKLQSYSEVEVRGIGDEAEKSGSTAFADKIQVGGMEFEDCAVEVVDGPRLAGIDGLIGPDVFSDFLVTLDYPGRKLILGPLPARPETGATQSPQLKLANEGEDDAAGPAAAGKGSGPSQAIAQGPFDRYIAPQMQGYTRVYRVGPHLILPTVLNSSKVRLFILDTGAFTTIVSPEAASEVTKVRSGSDIQVAGLNGKVEKLYTADNITFRFAHLSQNVEQAIAFDTSFVSKSDGMEISGFLGYTALFQLTLHIDYRDGLVKFDYDPKRVQRVPVW
jgi:tetratricopeptide (TPR) repeat protein